MSAFMHTDTYAYRHISTDTHMHTETYAHRHTHIDIYAHTHIHTCIQTQAMIVLSRR